MEQYFPYYIAALIVFVVGYTFFLIWRNNQKIKAFLAKHPDAARVKPQHVEWLIYRKSVQIQAVDDKLRSTSSAVSFRKASTSLRANMISWCLSRKVARASCISV